MEKRKMAAKSCPRCRNQVPVACKKCGCGHIFSAKRIGKGRKESPTTGVKVIPPKELDGDVGHIPLATLRHQLKQEEDLPRRRTGRVQREKPNFYDALEYDNQMRKKRMLKGKLKDDAPTKETTAVSVEENCPAESKSEPNPVQKKRRGRPPRLTGKGTKPVQTPVSLPLNNKTKQPKESTNGVDLQEDLMKDISPEKALQYNIILDDINRKWATVSWRI